MALEMIKPLRVENTMLLEDFDDDGDCRVHGVRDDKNKGLRRGCRDAGGEIADDASVDLCNYEQLYARIIIVVQTLNRSSLITVDTSVQTYQDLYKVFAHRVIWSTLEALSIS